MDPLDQEKASTETPSPSLPAWHTPSIADYDLVATTQITNCGVSSDGIICQGPS